MRIKQKRAVSMILILSVFLSLFMGGPFFTAEAEAASVPGFNAAKTEKNVMKILDRYDKDGAYVIRKAKAAGDKDLMRWFSGNGRITDYMDVAVHEQTHGYSLICAPYNKYFYFTGNKKSLKVKPTVIYHSKKMSKSIPKRCRTFRYSTYVGSPTANLISNIWGAYGLMNEFMAYRMGMNYNTKIFNYYAANHADFSTWMRLVNDGDNNRMAYAEFKYYILHYIYYAKKHYPAVYKGLMSNKNFCKAYYRMEKSYASLIKTYERDIKRIGSKIKDKGDKYEVTSSQILFYDSSKGAWYGYNFLFTSDYKTLKKELNKSKYKKIHNALVKKGRS